MNADAPTPATAGGFGAADFAEYARDFRHTLDQAIGQLQDFRGLARRQAGQCGGHVQHVALVQRRHEFTAEACCGNHADRQHNNRSNQGAARKTQDHGQ